MSEEVQENHDQSFLNEVNKKNQKLEKEIIREEVKPLKVTSSTNKNNAGKRRIKKLSKKCSNPQSYDSNNEKNKEESVKFYNEQYQILDNLTKEDKEQFTMLNFLSSLSLINQLYDVRGTHLKYLRKMSIQEET